VDTVATDGTASTATPRAEYVARAWRRHHEGSYWVTVDGVADAVPWDGEPTDLAVRKWLSRRLLVSSDAFDLAFTFDPGDVPSYEMRPD
jgi:hypothetical protein